jgi:hypothetical protein
VDYLIGKKMDIDSFFTNGDLSFGMDGNGGFKNFVGTGQNAWKHRGEYKFAPKELYGFKNDPQYAQFVDQGEGISLNDDFNNVAGEGVGNSETIYSPQYFNAYGGDKFNDLRKQDREGHGIRKYLDKLSEAQLKDCKVLDATLTAIKNEIVDNNRKALTSKREARVMEGYNRGLGIAKDEVTKLMKNAQCDVQDDAQFLAQLEEAGAGSKTSNYILYGGIAVAALGLGVVLYRAIKK